MKKWLGLFVLLCLPFAVLADAQVGAKAPDFSLPASDGSTVKLSQFEDKVVVLEWYNHDCPFVRKHYESNNMQTLQQQAKSQGIVWLSVISSAPGKQGHVTQKDAKEKLKDHHSGATAILLDEKGEVGRSFGAKTTPHMFVIDKEGKFAYAGAIDDVPSADKADVAKANNYVREAITSLKDGKPVKNAVTKSYGCSVKY